MLAGSTTLADVYVWFTYLHSSSAKDFEDSSVTYSADTLFGLPSFGVVSGSRHALGMYRCSTGSFQRDENEEISSI